MTDTFVLDENSEFLGRSAIFKSMNMASKEITEKKQSENIQIQNKNTNATNGVVIKVYVESVTTRSRKLSSEDPTNKTRRYDRRAQILAHSRKLRNAGSQMVLLHRNQSRPKSKEKRMRLTQPARICSCSPSTEMPPGSTSSRCTYERVASKAKNWPNNRNDDSGKNNSSPILRKLKKLLKELSCKEI